MYVAACAHKGLDLSSCDYAQLLCHRRWHNGAQQAAIKFLLYLGNAPMNRWHGYAVAVVVFVVMVLIGILAPTMHTYKTAEHHKASLIFGSEKRLWSAIASQTEGGDTPPSEVLRRLEDADQQTVRCPVTFEPLHINPDAAAWHDPDSHKEDVAVASECALQIGHEVMYQVVYFDGSGRLLRVLPDWVTRTGSH